MAEAASGHWPVLELGGGTGSITQALIESGIVPAQLAVIERNPVFYRLLVERFPLLRIVCGGAETIQRILLPADIGQVGTVISSLPRAGWPLERQRSILNQSFAALRPGGSFLEFSYGHVSPVPRRLVRELRLTARPLRRVWTNFPPATIWEYRRRDEPDGGASMPASDLTL